MENNAINRQRLMNQIDEMKKKIAKLEVSEDMHRWTEAKLQRESYEKDILLNNAPTMIYWLDIEGKFIIVNKCFADLFNKLPEDIVGKYLFDLYPESMADKIYADNVEIIESGIAKYSIEESFRTRNGEVKCFRSDKIPYKDTDGKIIGIIGVLSDITEQAENIKKIKESGEKFRAITERSYDVVFVTDKKGKLIYVSPSIEHSLGYIPEEITDKYFHGLFPENMNKKVEGMWNSLNQKKGIEGLNLEIFNKKRGIAIVEVNGLSIIKDEKFDGIQLHLRNITSRKVEEEIIEKEKNKLQKYIDLAGIILKTIDKEGRVSLINNRGCEVLGYAREDILNKNWVNHFVPERKREEMNLIFTELKLKKDNSYEHFKSPILTINGEERMINWYNTILKDEKGEFQGLLSTGEDVTVKSKIEQELQENYQKLQQIMEDTVYTMAKVVEKKDPYSAGHQKRVSLIATSIAKEMKLPAKKIEGLKVASLVHDIGKIGMPIEILCKPSGLTELGLELIKEHPMIGYNILKEIYFPWPVAEIVLQHHEKIDGSGYPNGLKSNEILIEARILCVADVIEAMSAYRSYRPSFSIKEALKELNKNRGILYDSMVVDACKALFKYKGTKFSYFQ